MKRIALLMVFLFAALVMAVEMEDAQAALSAADENIDVMFTAGFSVEQVNETYLQARSAFDKGYYGQVVQLSNQISATKDAAFEAYDIINEAKEKIYTDSEKGFDVTDANAVLRLADSAFDRADYTEAMRLAQEASTLQHHRLGTKLTAFLSTSWKGILLTLVALVLIIGLSYNAVFDKYVDFKLKGIEDEEKEIEKLIQGTDEKYYKHKAIGDEEYKHTRAGHEDKQAKLRQRKASLKAKKHK